MADNICVGIKTTGDRCTRRCPEGLNRCNVHQKTLLDNGPNRTAIKELKLTHKKQTKDLQEQLRERARTTQNHQQLRDVLEDNDDELRRLKIQQGREVRILERQQRDEIIRTGLNPDAEADARRHQEQQRRIAERRDAMREELIRERQHAEALRLQLEIENQQQLLAQIQNNNAGNGGVRQLREEAEFVRDNQNIHRTSTVEMVKKTINEVLKIQVPDEYCWKADECSKTPGDIIVKCKLSSKAAWQMTAKYCQDEDIYDLGRGIYGKVLDCVWQFILNSEHKEDLYKILKQEMEDNIGMCAQGNLSRLCNILSGYMDKIGNQESPSEILQRQLPKLMEIDNPQERVNAALKVFNEVKLPMDEWPTWLKPLIEDEDEDYAIDIVKNDQGIIAQVRLITA
jgi:hypothetical protein